LRGTYYFRATKRQDKQPSHVRNTEQRYDKIRNSNSFVYNKTRAYLKKWPVW